MSRREAPQYLHLPVMVANPALPAGGGSAKTAAVVEAAEPAKEEPEQSRPAQPIPEEHHVQAEDLGADGRGSQGSHDATLDIEPGLEQVLSRLDEELAAQGEQVHQLGPGPGPGAY